MLRFLSILFTVPIAVLEAVGTMRGVGESAEGRILYATGAALQGGGIVVFMAILGVLHREVRELESVGVSGCRGRRKEDGEGLFGRGMEIRFWLWYVYPSPFSFLPFL